MREGLRINHSLSNGPRHAWSGGNGALLIRAEIDRTRARVWRSTALAPSPTRKHRPPVGQFAAQNVQSPFVQVERVSSRHRVAVTGCAGPSSGECAETRRHRAFHGRSGPRGPMARILRCRLAMDTSQMQPRDIATTFGNKLGMVALHTKALLGDLRKDAERYQGLGGWRRNSGFWIGATHRFGEWAATVPSAPVRLPLRGSYRFASRMWRTLFNVHIAGGAKIGPGLCLIHPRNIMVAPTEIGANCLIFHEVTLGTNANRSGLPKIGNDVDIYVGARLLGGVEIGDSAKIGANCVVTSNVRAGTVVVPAATRTVSSTLVQAFGPRHHDLPREGSSKLAANVC